MGLLIVDESKCKKDGICAKECPMAIIRLQDKESYPELIAGGNRSVPSAGIAWPSALTGRSVIPWFY
jgi:hypothetical protein